MEVRLRQRMRQLSRIPSGPLLLVTLGRHTDRARPEHYKLLVEHSDAFAPLAEAATILARADVLHVIAEGLAMTRMTALHKPGGGVRGIATSDTFRRLVSRTLAAAWTPVFDEATPPFQYPLCTGAGVDALTARLHVTLESDPQATAVSLDGRSAYMRIRLHFPGSLLA